jgi:tRNA-2-methylthio-N6-dimethylallyladenosine synthase
LRARRAAVALSSDIIVGFPGETEDDFEQTLAAVRAARFASAFTFQYSKRPGTPAADMPGQVPRAVVTERYERLVAVQDAISWDLAKQLVGREVEVLVGDGGGRKDAATGRVSGRSRDGRLVHVAGTAAPGDIVRADVTYAAPHHLVADAGIREHRPWPGAAVLQHAEPTQPKQLLTIGPRPQR